MKAGPFQAALLVPSTSAPQVEQGLRALQALEPPLRRVELRSAAGAETFLLLLGFDDSRAFTLHHTRVGGLATVLSAQVRDLEQFDDAARAGFEAQRESLPLRASAAGDLSLLFTELRRHALAPRLRVAFASSAELLAAWARHIEEGALWVPTKRAPDARSFDVVFVTPQDELAGNHATRVLRAPPPGQTGLWLELHPGEALLELIMRAGEAKSDSRRMRVSTKSIERYRSDLDMEFLTFEQLRECFEGELSLGRLFVPTSAQPALREKLRLHLVLPNGEILTLPAEVVHRVESGERPGVGVQLLNLKPDSLAPIQKLLADGHHKPRVLVVEDEAAWRAKLVTLLRALDVDVTLAHDGREGLVKLIDGYFELDLVIIDLHMPRLDGVGLIDRVRRLGGDLAIKIFLLADEPRAELRKVVKEDAATRVFSKQEPLELLRDEVARALGRSG